jgi:mono/diheme cytochrome c family protein
MAGIMPKGYGRPLLLIGFLVVLLLSGCGEPGYPEDLTYPERGDPLLVPGPEIDVQTDIPDAPGRLAEQIARIPDVTKGKNQIFYPDRLRHPEFRAAIRTVLNGSFGTPARPLVDLPTDHPSRPALRDAIDRLRLEEPMLAEGSKLYRRHCLHCHGLAGDGRGPSGPWLNPHPRDYRQGLFKFISTDNGGFSRPTRDDLYRTIQHGIEGTSMPSFRTLSNDELHALVSYVIHLSLRGEVEFRALLLARDREEELDGKDGTRKPDAEEVRAAAREVGQEAQGLVSVLTVDAWAASAKKVQTPATERVPPTEDSIRKGYELITKSDSKVKTCIGCHLDFGRQARFRYDLWGTLVRPNNWTAGVYRGGRRPIDLYWRLKVGIKPSAMPPFPQGDDEEIWHVVNFLQALPYPQMLPADVRRKVYDNKDAHAE